MYKEVVYNLKTHQLVDKRELGTMGTISWERLAEVLKKPELLPGESIVQFTVTKRGLEFMVEGNTDA